MVPTAPNGVKVEPCAVCASSCRGSRLTQTGISLAVGQTLRLSLKLEVGQLTEQIEVRAEAPLIDATTVSSGQNFDRRLVEALPMFSNMPIMLSRFTPGVARASFHGISPKRPVYRHTRCSILWRRPVVFPVVLIAVIVAIAATHRYLDTRAEPLRAAVSMGCFLGVLRATLASGGWYVVEHTGGSLQVPAFALAMLAWPEAMIFAERRTTPAPAGFYFWLSLLLFTSTVVLVGAVGAITTLRRRRVSQRSRD